MKRFVVVFLVFFIFLPGVLAESSISGWIRLGNGVGANGESAFFKDVSFRDGSLFVKLSATNVSRTDVLPIGGGVKWGAGYLVLYSTMTGGESTYFNVTYTFPYLLEGRELRIGDYTVYLESVGEKKAVLLIHHGDVYKKIIYSGGTLKFDNLRLSLRLMPQVLNGYLVKGASVQLGEWVVRYDGYRTSATGNEVNVMVLLNVNGKEYTVKTGDELEVGNLLISVGNVIGADYLLAKATIRGAYVKATLLPTFEGWLDEGKSVKLGPYLVRVEAVGLGGAYIAVMNSCGRILKRGFATVGRFSQGVYFGGLMVGISGMREYRGVRQVHVLAFLDSKDIPKAGDFAYLNVSLSAPSKVRQYVPFTANVSITNSGSVDVGYVEVIPRFQDGFKLASEYPHYLKVIKKGKTVRFSLELLPEKSGKIALGDILVVAHVPYELSCYGISEVNFTSEKRNIEVEPAVVSFKVSIAAKNGTVGEKIPITVHVENLGGTVDRGTLTMAFPEGFAFSADNFTLYGKWLVRSITVPSKGSMNFTIYAVPLKGGKFRITAGVESHGEVFHNSTTIYVTENPQTPAKAPSNLTNGTCKEKVITQIIKVPKPCNSTNVTQVTGGTSFKEKLLYVIPSFLAGIVFVLGLAWLAARFEEEGVEE